MNEDYAGPFGECPDVSIPAVVREIDELRTENLLLRSQLEVARDQLATARCDAQYYKNQQRSGW